MEDAVDVKHYRASQPLIVLQQGVVVRARPYPDMVQWEDGTKEKVHVACMPGEFVIYKPGQPFEAMVHRDPVSHQILKVEYVRRLPSRQADADESRRLWDSVPTSASLPDADWD